MASHHRIENPPNQNMMDLRVIANKQNQYGRLYGFHDRRSKQHVLPDNASLHRARSWRKNNCQVKNNEFQWDKAYQWMTTVTTLHQYWDNLVKSHVGKTGYGKIILSQAMLFISAFTLFKINNECKPSYDWMVNG